MVVFCDEDFNVLLVNLLNYKIVDLGKNFKVLDVNEFSELESLILSKNNKYKI